MASSITSSREIISEAALSAVDVELASVGGPRERTEAPGTEWDQKHMKGLGRKQQTHRRFYIRGVIGFGSVLIGTWEIIFVSFPSIIENGGTATLFWGFIIVCGGFLPIYGSLGELCSMAPTSGGQYHWTSLFAPVSCQKFLSFLVGWLCSLGWVGGITGVNMLVATMIQGLIKFHHAGYESQGWHGTAITIFLVLICGVLNAWGLHKLPWVGGCLAIVHAVGFVATIILLCIYGRDRSAHDAFLDIRDGGWSTPALGFLSQLGVLIVTMNGFDSQVHIGMLHVQGSFIGKKHSVDAHAAEETKDADTAIPTSLGWSVSLNAVSGVILTLILVLKTGGLERIVENATGLPSINLMFDLSGIPILTTCLVVTIIIALCGSAIECLTTASRQIWALGRDNGLPFSDRLQTTKGRHATPRAAVYACTLLCVPLSLINTFSPVALTAILSLGTGSLMLSYMICIGCVVLKRIRGEALPARRRSLGRYGRLINGFAVLCSLFFAVFLFFPSVPRPNAVSMNYAGPMIAAVILFASGYYYTVGRHRYNSPRGKFRTSG